MLALSPRDTENITHAYFTSLSLCVTLSLKLVASMTVQGIVYKRIPFLAESYSR